MNKTQLRNKRKQLRTERLEILHQIDQLQNNLAIEKDSKKYQKISDEIKRLGELLEQKVTVQVTDHNFVNSNKDFQDYAKAEKTPWSMPFESYARLKKQGHTDKEIAQLEGVAEIQIRKWKSRNGITRGSWMKDAN